MALYLLAGALGAPVFSGGSAGIGVLLGPTGGYLVSYPFAAALVGAVVHGVDGLADPETVPLPRLVGGMVAGTAIIYALGILVYWQSLDVGLVEATVGAAVVFVPVEALKIAAAVGIVRSDSITAA
jgi:biotin transport system substrate-specific component